MDFARPKTNAARSAASRACGERILIVGPLGQGVGLLADAIGLAAAHCGTSAGSSEFMRPALGRRTCAALVRLGDAAMLERGQAQLLLAFGAAAALGARPLLADSGVGLAMIDPPASTHHWRLGPLFDRRIHWWAAPATSAAPLAKVWSMLGWLSCQLALPVAAWREALHASVPKRMTSGTWHAFEHARSGHFRTRHPGLT